MDRLVIGIKFINYHPDPGTSQLVDKVFDLRVCVEVVNSHGSFTHSDLSGYQPSRIL